MTGTIAFLVLFYMIMGIVINHRILSEMGAFIWNLKAFIIKDIIGSFIFGMLMTGIILKFWYVAAIIIVLIGFGVAGKTSNPMYKKVIVGIFVILAVVIAVAGISYGKAEKEKKQEAKKAELINQYSLYDSYAAELSDFVYENQTYVMENGDSKVYMNATLYYDKDIAPVPTYSLRFLKLDNNEMNDNIIEENFTSTKKDCLKFVNDNDKKSFFMLDETPESVDITMPTDKKDYSGTYTLATSRDEETFYNLLKKSKYYTEESYEEDEEDYYEEEYGDDEEVDDSEDDTEGYTEEELCKAAEAHYYYTQGDRPPHVVSYEEDGKVIIQLYEDGSGIATTWDRYYIDPTTGVGTNDAGENVDLSTYMEVDLDEEGVTEDDTNDLVALYQVEVTAPDGYVNVRTSGSTEADIVGTISNGTILDVYDESGKWLQIEYDGALCWIASSQVTKKGDLTSGSAEYVLPNSQNEYITEKDLQGLTKEQCRIARNEIYARHGKIFQSQDLVDYFCSTSWYMTDEGYDDSNLSQLEKDNINTIAAYEEKMGYK